MSVPHLLLEAAASRPNAPAMRKKELGRWREYTFAEYAERAARVGAALRALGVQPGDRVAIQSGNRPAWMITDAAIQGIGAVSVGVDPDAEAGDSLSGLRDAVVIVAEDEEQLDKTLELRDQLSSLRRIVVIDPRGIRNLEAVAMTFTELEKSGGDNPVDSWRSTASAIAADAPAVVVRGGETVTHGRLLAEAVAAEGAINGHPDDDVVSFLPLDRIEERLVSQVAALQRGFVVHFGEGADSFAADMREVQPTILLADAAVWELTVAGVELRMKDASGFKRRVYRQFMDKGGGGPLGRVALHRPLRSKLGLSRLRHGMSIGRPLAPEAAAFFSRLGAPVHDVGPRLGGSDI